MPRYKRSELPPGQTDWSRATNAEPDAENPLWDAEAFAQADLVTPGGLTRTPVYIRMYTVVLEWYKSFGKGYQTRINNDLLDLMRKRQARESRVQPVKQQRIRVVAGSQWGNGRSSTPVAG